jgi:hypothetical protein
MRSDALPVGLIATALEWIDSSDAICSTPSWIMTIIHELLAETGLGQPDSGTLVRSGAVRRSASALVHLPLRSLSRDAMPSLRDGVHTDKPSIPKGPQMQRLQKWHEFETKRR